MQGDHVVVSNTALEPVEVRPKVGRYTPGTRARLGVRPQYLTPVVGDGAGTPPNAGRLHGKVVLTERLGAETVVETTLVDQSRVIAALSRDAVYPVGAEVTLSFRPEEAHLFPA